MHRGIVLFGNNISYTLSPVIHNTAFRISDLPYLYLTADIEPAQFKNALDAAQILKFAGANVTIPFKETVLKHTTSLSDAAKKIGAVNTLYFDKGKILGENSDSPGFFKAYFNELKSLEDKTVLILGAGGAARAVCDTIITKTTPKKMLIVNRNTERSNQLIEHLRNVYDFNSADSISMETSALQEAAGDAAGIIQTTPVGSGRYINQSPVAESFQFNKEHVVIDLIYNPLETKFLKQAGHSGARTRNGISMLLHQAAYSFTLWTGQTFPMDEVTPVVMEHIKQRT